MRKFLPLVFALVFTTLAVGVTLFWVKPGIRSIPVPDGWRHKLAEVLDEIEEQEEDR